MPLSRAIALCPPIATLLFACCADLGTTLDVGNPSVSGIIYKPDGHSPACGAKVVLFKPSNTLPKKIDSAYTGKEGDFCFRHLSTDTFSLEGSDVDGNMALVNAFEYSDTTETKMLPPETLKPPGVIKGKVVLTEPDGDPRKVAIQLFETIKNIIVDEDGSFTVTSLAEATYTLRFNPSLDNYDILDTKVRVISGDTTDIGPVIPPFRGIPTPKNVAAVNDMAEQIVSVTWNQADTSKVSGYIVYRRPAGSNELFSALNYKPVSIPQFRDSTVFGNLSFEYKVSCVAKNGDEGTKSAAATVLASSYFTFDKTAPVCDGGSLTAMAIAFPGTLYAGSNTYGLYQTAVFDSSLNRLSVLNLLDQTTIRAAVDGTLYGCARDNTLIAINSLTTAETRRYDLRLSNFVAASGSRIVGFAGTAHDSIMVIAIGDGAVITEFPLPDSSPVNGSLAVDNNDHIYLCGKRENAIIVYTCAGAFVRLVQVGTQPLAVTVDDAGRIAIIVQRPNGYKLEIYKPEGTFFARCNLTQFTPCRVGGDGAGQCAFVNYGPSFFLGTVDPGMPSSARIRVAKITFQMPR
jgi:hypothetical protein